MMKKTLCLLFVLAFIAQICAIPVPSDNDEADELEGVAKEAKGKADKAKHKAAAIPDEEDAEAEAKAAAKKAAAKLKHKKAEAIPIEEDSEAAEAKAKKAAHHPGKHAKDCHKPGAGPSTNPISNLRDFPKRAIEVGEKFVKAGINFEKELLGTFFG